MRYKEFLQVEIAHQYFASDLAGLVLVPQERTLKFLRGQHFLVKRTARGIKILVPINEEGQALPIVDDGDVLAFDVFPTSGIVGEFTDDSALSHGKVLLFTNEGLGEGELELFVSETTAGETFEDFPVIAKIEIKASEVDLNGPAPIYRAIFKSKSVKWRYYFVSNPGTTGLDVKERNGQLTFNEVILQDERSDQIATSIRLNFPGTQLVVFESDTSIPYSNKAIKNIQLLQNENVVIKHLPNPDAIDHGIQIIQIR